MAYIIVKPNKLLANVIPFPIPMVTFSIYSKRGFIVNVNLIHSNLIRLEYHDVISFSVLVMIFCRLTEMVVTEIEVSV